MNFGDKFCKLCLILVIVVIFNSIVGDLIFRLQYSFPKVSEKTQEIIEYQINPIQQNLNNADYIKAYGQKNIYALKPQAKYTLAGLVIAKNNNFWFRDIMRTTFDDICLMDLGIAWGDLAQDKTKLYKHWKFKSRKSLGQARQLEWRQKPPYENGPWTVNYVRTHISHTHLIPANSNVMGGLLKIKKNDIVKLNGYLVDIYTDKNELVARTSMTRTDNDATSRGYGACEDMYVERVQIGNRIYR